jgi:hypothetical protein
MVCVLPVLSVAILFAPLFQFPKPFLALCSNLMKMMVQLQWDKGTESSPLIRQWLIDHSY